MKTDYPTITSTEIAAQCEIPRDQVLQIIDDHGDDADFGRIRFENHGGMRVACLDVRQACFIFLMLPNTPFVTGIKASFVRAVFSKTSAKSPLAPN